MNDETNQAKKRGNIQNSFESDPLRFRALVKASFIAIGADVFLIMLKYFLAQLTGSTVLLADALHSGGDFAISLTVLISIVINHHFKTIKWAKYAEIIVAMLISFVLIIGSIIVLANVLSKDPSGFVLISDIPLVVAFFGISIAVAFTFMMFRFKRMVGEKHNSIAFIAESAHTHSDFFTSLGVWITLLLGYFGIHIERVMTFIVGLLVFRIGVMLFLRALTFINVWKRMITQGEKYISIGYQKKAKDVWQGFIQFSKKIKFRIPRKLILDEDWILARKMRILLLIILMVILLYIGTGFYSVQPYQTGVELLFGKVVGQNTPGPHFHFPKPFGEVILVDTAVIARVESGFRTNWAENIEEPEAYLWELLHTDGKFRKVMEESIAITGDENLIDGNFLCYFRITDPVEYALNSENAHEILRSLFCHEVHSILAYYRLDHILTSKRGTIQEELTGNMKKAIKILPIGVEILGVHMQEAHPPIVVVPEYRSVASAREKKDEIIHKATAYANDLLPHSRGKSQARILKSHAYAIEKKSIAKGRSINFLLKKEYFNKYPAVQQVRLLWEMLESVFKDKAIFILPHNAKRRFYTFDSKEEEYKFELEELEQ
jgi:membrane protease subunit HflK